MLPGMIFELKIDQTAFADPLGSLRLRNFPKTHQVVFRGLLHGTGRKGGGRGGRRVREGGAFPTSVLRFNQCPLEMV